MPSAVGFWGCPGLFGKLLPELWEGKRAGKEEGREARGCSWSSRQPALGKAWDQAHKGKKINPTPGVKHAFGTTPHLRSAAAHMHPTAPTHPQVTGPHVLVSGLVNYLINGLPGQANLDLILKGQFSGQAPAAVCLPTSGEDLVPG